MSLVEPEKLIILISDLEDMLSSWNVAASDACALTEKLSRESGEVHNLAEKDKSRSADIEGDDYREIERSKKDGESLYEKCQELLQLTSRLPDEAAIREQKWRRACEVSNQHIKEVDEWLNTASHELQRAQNELEDAENDYEKQVTRYDNAQSTLNSTPPYVEIEKTDLKGRPFKEQAPNPEYERARRDVEAQAQELRRKEGVLKEKRWYHERAQEQFDQANRASELAQDMHDRAQKYLEKSLDLKEWANNAERSATYAHSAIESAQRYDNDAKSLNEKQKDFNENITREFQKLKSTLEDFVNVVHNIKELSSVCNTINVQFLNTLDIKRTLLHRLAAISPDNIEPFKTY